MNDVDHNQLALARDEASTLLTQTGITPTNQRVEIAQVLFCKPQHVCAEQVLTDLLPEGSKVSKATVYNTLGLFAEKGLLREVIVDPGRVFYDTTTSQHHHFYNVDTGELIDIHGDQLSLDQFPDLPAGTEAEGVDVIVRIRSKNLI